MNESEDLRPRKAPRSITEEVEAFVSLGGFKRGTSETEEQWRLQVAKAEAWDEGYHAAKEEWHRYNQGLLGGPPENPYDRLPR